MEEELNFKDSIKIIFKNLSFEKIYKHVLEELEEISKEKDDINIKIDKKRLNNLIDELNKIVEELKRKKSKVNNQIIKNNFKKIINDLIEIRELTNHPYFKYEIEQKLNKLKYDMEEIFIFIKRQKIGVSVFSSIILVLLGGILTAIIAPTLKSKKLKIKTKHKKYY